MAASFAVMRGHSTLMLMLFRTAYLYIMTLYTACALLGFPGSVVGLAATAILALSVETRPLWAAKNANIDEKELRYIV